MVVFSIFSFSSRSLGRFGIQFDGHAYFSNRLKLNHQLQFIRGSMTPLMPLGPKMVNIGIFLFIFGTPMKNGIFSISTGGCRIPSINYVVLQGPPRRSRKLKIMIWVFPKIGVPQNGWFIMENPLKWMIWGYIPLFSETPIWVVVSFFFNVHPKPWGNDPIWPAYFSIGLVQPPPRYNNPLPTVFFVLQGYIRFPKRSVQWFYSVLRSSGNKYHGQTSDSPSWFSELWENFLWFLNWRQTWHDSS